MEFPEKPKLESIEAYEELKKIKREGNAGLSLGLLYLDHICYSVMEDNGLIAWERKFYPEHPEAPPGHDPFRGLTIKRKLYAGTKEEFLEFVNTMLWKEILGKAFWGGDLHWVISEANERVRREQ